MTIQIKITDGLERFNRFTQAVNRQQATEMLDQVGGLIVVQTRRRIQTGGPGPLNEVWPPLADWYKTLKAGKSTGGLLWYDGDLHESIEMDISGDTLEVGSNKEYAATMQFGGKTSWGNVPARPYLGLSDTDEDEIEEAVADWMKANWLMEFAT